VVIRSSLAVAAAAGGGSAVVFSTAMATTSPVPVCTVSGSAYGDWGWGSEGTTRALNAKSFKGARLRTPVSVRLQKRQNEVGEWTKRKTHDDDSKDKDLQLGADLGPLHWTVRRAMLGGCTIGANRLGGSIASPHHLDGRAALPQLLGGYPPDLRRGRGRSLAPAGDEGRRRIIND
jgi:hypothetical protein